jgi:acyl-[acyl-carrier-protein]-phospholipid O-acyltransferase / long-chain-fatty-acid--[acyl-carrier-protein] ligase
MISLIRVEGAVEKCLPADVECCVVEVPDSLRGAKIVAVTTKPVDEKAIVKQISAYLPNIAMPKQFIVMDELPKMGSGKIDFRTITERTRDIVQR